MDNYQDLINEISKKLSDEILSTENELEKRATTIDGDIQKIIQEIGLKTCDHVLTETKNKIVEKKSKKVM